MRKRDNYFWRLSANGRSSWIFIQFIFMRHVSHVTLFEDAFNESDCVSSEKISLPDPTGVPRTINRAAAPITFSVNDTYTWVGGGGGGRRVYDKGDGSARPCS